MIEEYQKYAFLSTLNLFLYGTGDSGETKLASAANSLPEGKVLIFQYPAAYIHWCHLATMSAAIAGYLVDNSLAHTFAEAVFNLL